MSAVEGISMEGFKKLDSENMEDETSNDIPQARGPPVHIIRYSTAALFALRSSKLSQQKPACKNMELACMIHMKPPPKMLIVNMMPKFALNQMPNRGEESISPLSFHSNSSSSSNLSYQKRYQDGNNGGSIQDGYSNNRYYYNKYNKNNEDGSSRIIYKTTGANSSNGNSIRFLKKAYNSKYEEQDNSIGLISNKNILENSSRVITAADHRNSRKKLLLDEDSNNENRNKKSNDVTGNNEKGEKLPSDDANNNSENDKDDNKKLTEVNANDLMLRNDLKKPPKELDITNHMDDIFNDLNINQLLDENAPDDRGSSRFSKWFSTNKDESKDENIFPDTQNNNSKNSTNLSLFAHETEKFFQPIEKVESNSLFQMMKGHELEGQRNDSLMNMLKNPPPSSSSSAAMSPGSSGQVHSVEELEAKLRQHNDDKDRKSNENEKKVLQNFFQQQIIPNLMQQPQQQQQQRPSQNQDDINAFKKFLSQITNENEKVSSNPIVAPPVNQNMLQQLMNKGFQNSPEAMNQYPKSFPIVGKVQPQVNSQKVVNPINPGNHMIQQFAGNMDLKFLPQQPQKIPVPEIIKRPEVQALIQELTSGEISQYTLWQRLTAPGLTPIERDIITCALNVFNANSNGGGSGIFPKQPIAPAPNMFPPPPTGPIAPNQNQALHQLMQHQIKANTLTAPIPIPPQTSPLSPVPPLEQHLLFQHQAAVAANKQLRLSPLPAGFSMGPAVIPPNNLTLHVPGMPQRIPSPRELQYHTQSIMQNALIRKKLEEQRENFRKRQEQEKQECAKKGGPQDPSSTSNADQMSDQQIIVTPQASSQEDVVKISPDSPTKKVMTSVAQVQAQRQHAPSPSIFTPTSVLRKMTAEKPESDSGKPNSSMNRMDDKKKQVSNMPQHQIQRNQMQQPFMNNIPPADRIKMQNEAFGMNSWDGHQQQQSIQQGIKPPGGRPIVKSSPAQQGGNQQQGASANIQPQNPINFDFQHQQMQKLNQIQKAQFLQQQQMMQMKKQQMDNNPVLSQFMAQQQQRAQSQFRSPFQQPQQPTQQQLNFQSMMQGRTEKNDDLLDNRNILNNGGCLSPTSNQLAKWFSPELLADASAGKLLPSLNVGQMMSLEELEKCMQNS